jgi:hypothetical protein
VTERIDELSSDVNTWTGAMMTTTVLISVLKLAR